MSIGYVAKEILSLHASVRKQQTKTCFLSFRAELGEMKSYLVI